MSAKAIPSDPTSVPPDWQQRAQALETEIDQRAWMQEAATRLAAIVESSDDAIISKDFNGVVTSWNASAERIFGYKAEEMVGRPITVIIPPELQHDEEMILSRIRRGERIEHFETVRVSKSGQRVDVSLTVSPVKDGAGRVVGAAKIARDISQRKRTEEALRRAEKFAATGQLAAAIAHEVNNPMQALTNLFALISTRSLDPDTRKLLALAEGELGRMSQITRQMLSFYRETANPVPLQLSGIIDDVLEVLASSLRANRIKVERSYEFDGQVQAFPGEMRQLFTNLVSNAADAVGQRGRIWIRVVSSRDWAQPDRHGVRVMIADNGPGIPSEIRRHIFEPFFTTKAGKGTGLGLWVVSGIVTKHEGKIRVRSSTAPGRAGTAFSVFLPGASITA